MAQDRDVLATEAVAEVVLGADVCACCAGGSVNEPNVPVWCVFGADAAGADVDVLEGGDGGGSDSENEDGGSGETHVEVDIGGLDC